MSVLKRSLKYQLIRDAIATRQQVIATYQGHIRKMCPHLIGLKQGKEHGLFYQFGGSSNSRGKIETDTDSNWRCIPIEGLKKITIRKGKWHTSPADPSKQSCVDEVDLEVH